MPSSAMTVLSTSKHTQSEVRHASRTPADMSTSVAEWDLRPREPEISGNFWLLHQAGCSWSTSVLCRPIHHYLTLASMLISYRSYHKEEFLKWSSQFGFFTTDLQLTKLIFLQFPRAPSVGVGSQRLLRRTLGDRHRRRGRVAAGDGRHDARVGSTQPADAVHEQQWRHDRERI